MGVATAKIVVQSLPLNSAGATTPLPSAPTMGASSSDSTQAGLVISAVDLTVVLITTVPETVCDFEYSEFEWRDDDDCDIGLVRRRQGSEQVLSVDHLYVMAVNRDYDDCTFTRAPLRAP